MHVNEVLRSNQAVQQELSELKETHRTEVEMMIEVHKHELEEVKKICVEKVQLVETQLEMLKTKTKGDHEDLELNNESELIKHLAEFKLEVEQKFVSLTVNTTPLQMPPFYFTVNNIEHYQENNYSWYSDLFYSHPGGYKMVVAVYPNGRANAIGTHLSVYVNIICGEFDDQLQWPFHGEIFVEAWKQTTNQWTNRKTIPLNPHRADFEAVSKPTNRKRNARLGFSKYIIHSDLPNYYTTLIKGDSVEFRILRVNLASSKY